MDSMLVIGLISGTSVDAIDAVLCELAPDPLSQNTLTVRIIAQQEVAFPQDLRQQVLQVCYDKQARLDDLTELNFRLGQIFAEAASQVADMAHLPLSSVDLIASHGQTIYHLVDAGRIPSTLQMGEPAVIAHRTGVTTVADFRVADMAAGGQGAPLASFLDVLLFSDENVTRALQNIGGIGNVTFLPADSSSAIAFDTGPGNVLLDYGARYFSQGWLSYDQDGAMARAGHVNTQLLEEALSHTYFQTPPPKTTGRELFGDSYAHDLITHAAQCALSLEDTMATLTALTAESIIRAYRDFGPAHIDEVIISGGGVRNPVLLEYLRAGLPGTQISNFDDTGLSASIKEAVTFAVIGYEAIHGRPGNIPSCTGATIKATLGKIAPGTNYMALMQQVIANNTSEQSSTRKLRLLEK